MGVETSAPKPKSALLRGLEQILFSNVPSAAEEETTYLAKMKRLGIPPDGKGGLDPLWILLLIVDGMMETLGFYKPYNMPKYENPPPRSPQEQKTTISFGAVFNEIIQDALTKSFWE